MHTDIVLLAVLADLVVTWLLAVEAAAVVVPTLPQSIVERSSTPPYTTTPPVFQDIPKLAGAETLPTLSPIDPLSPPWLHETQDLTRVFSRRSDMKTLSLRGKSKPTPKPKPSLDQNVVDSALDKLFKPTPKPGLDQNVVNSVFDKLFGPSATPQPQPHPIPKPGAKPTSVSVPTANPPKPKPQNEFESLSSKLFGPSNKPKPNPIATPTITGTLMPTQTAVPKPGKDYQSIIDEILGPSPKPKVGETVNVSHIDGPTGRVVTSAMYSCNVVQPIPLCFINTQSCVAKWLVEVRNFEARCKQFQDGLGRVYGDGSQPRFLRGPCGQAYKPRIRQSCGQFVNVPGNGNTGSGSSLYNGGNKTQTGGTPTAVTRWDGYEAWIKAFLIGRIEDVDIVKTGARGWPILEFIEPGMKRPKSAPVGGSLPTVQPGAPFASASWTLKPAGQPAPMSAQTVSTPPALTSSYQAPGPFLPWPVDSARDTTTVSSPEANRVLKWSADKPSSHPQDW